MSRPIESLEALLSDEWLAEQEALLAELKQSLANLPTAEELAVGRLAVEIELGPSL